MIKAIFISKTKNGKIESPSSVKVLAGRGIENDRYFLAKNRKSPDFQITFIESEKIDEYNDSHADRIEYWQPRRNILTAGIDLNSLLGQRFRIGACVFEGLMLCEPCSLLKKRTSAEASKWFVGKGGLRARVVTGGTLSVGQRI